MGSAFTDHDTNEGWIQLGDNVTQVLGGTADAAIAAPSVSDMRAAQQFFQPVGDAGALPHLDLFSGGGESALAGMPGADGAAFTGAMPAGGDQMMSPLLDMITKFPGPMGILDALFEFFKELFSGEMLAELAEGAGQAMSEAAHVAEEALEKKLF